MYRHTRIARKVSRGNVWWFFFAFLVMVLLYPSFSQAKVEKGLSFAWISVKGSHVRQAPEMGSKSMEILQRGQLVLVLEKKDKWTKVQYEQGKTGWIFTKNLSFGLPEKLPKADRILLVKDHAEKDKGALEVYFNGKINDKIYAFEMKNPARLVVDIKGLKSSRNKSFSFGESALVSELKLGVHPEMTRFVFVLKKEIKKFSHSVSSEKNALSFALLLGKPSHVKTVASKKARKRLVKSKKVYRSPVAKPISRRARIVRITKTGFKDEAARSMVILSVSSPPSYYVKFAKGKVGLILNDAEIDKRYMRFLDTSGFPTPVKKVEFKNIIDKKGGKRAEVWVTTTEMVPYDVVVGSRSLKWIFRKPKTFVSKARKAGKEPFKRGKKRVPEVKKESKPGAVKVKTGAVPASKTKEKGPQVSLKPKYTGAKMSFDFQNADIHNVLRLIAEVSNLNIVAGDDVRGKITLRLKNVPWDQALDLILESKGLGKEQIGNVLRIAPKAKLKKEIQERIASKKVKEKLEPRVTEYIPVNYTTAKDLSVKIKPMLSSRGTVTVDERTNTLIVKDIPKKVGDIKEVVKRLDTPTPEVLIEARIVEAAKEFTREFGIKWGATYNRDPMHGNPLSNDFPNAMNVRGGATGQAGGGTTGTTGTTATGLLPMVNLPATASYGAIGVSLEQIVDIFTLDMELTAMEDNGKGRVISSPRIATLDNKTAKIEQGLRIPYLKITEEGTVTTEFIEANLNLEVTPHVSNDKMINMDVKVSKDTPDWSHLVQGVPSIDKKEATTNVMVRDGGVTAIGGIFTIEKSNTIHKVPLFGDIPILGWAFKNKRVVKNRKELLIFISPRLIPLKGRK